MIKFQYGVIGLIALILVAQTASVAYAHHADNYHPRTDMKSKSEKINAEKKVKDDKIQAAYVEYKTAFKVWTTASSDYKIAKISGDSQDKKTAKENRSSAYDNMMQKWGVYLELKK